MSKLFIGLCLVMISSAHAENKGGGGGEEVAANFVEYTRYAIESLNWDVKSGKEAKFTPGQSQKIGQALEVTEVFAVPASALCKTETSIVSGDEFTVCKDAWYDQEKKIILVNQETWIKKTCLQKKALVLHEYGRAAGLENANYAFSSNVFTSSQFKSSCTYIESQEHYARQRAGQCK